MQIRDRIKELRRVKASLLKPHPKNWRTHPQHQQDAMRGVLAEIGYADALLARELPDGTFELVDGHLRAETTPEMEVPVLILDLDDAEADKLLALHDPLAAMADTNAGVLGELLENVDTENEALAGVIEKLLEEPPLPLDETPSIPDEVSIPEAFQVVVECEDETQQQEVYERMTAEGYKCRLLTL
jgi:ParB-like chromosome segregation protein Spo0J